MPSHVRPSASLYLFLPTLRILDALHRMTAFGQPRFRRSVLQLCMTALQDVWSLFGSSKPYSSLRNCDIATKSNRIASIHPNALLPLYVFTFIALRQANQETRCPLCNSTHQRDCQRSRCFNQAWDYDLRWNALALWKSCIGFSRLGLYHCKQVDDMPK